METSGFIADYTLTEFGSKWRQGSFWLGRPKIRQDFHRPASTDMPVGPLKNSMLASESGLRSVFGKASPYRK
jgi:hypothetical protein